MKNILLTSVLIFFFLPIGRAEDCVPIEVRSEFDENTWNALGIFAIASHKLNSSVLKPHNIVPLKSKQGFFTKYHRHGKTLQIIALRGAIELNDWMINSQLQLTSQGLSVPRSIGRSHTGFNRRIQDLLQEFKPLLEKDSDSPIYVTGYSMGGALAPMLGGALVLKGFNVLGVYSFAAPKLGDLEYVKKGLEDSTLFQKWYRTEVEGDPIPHIPPSEENLHLLEETKMAEFYRSTLLRELFWNIAKKSSVQYAHPSKPHRLIRSSNDTDPGECLQKMAEDVGSALIETNGKVRYDEEWWKINLTEDFAKTCVSMHHPRHYSKRFQKKNVCPSEPFPDP